MHIRTCIILAHINKLFQVTRETQYINKHLDNSVSAFSLSYRPCCPLVCDVLYQLAKGPSACIGHYPAETTKDCVFKVAGYHIPSPPV